MAGKQISRLDLASFLLSPSLFVMIVLMVVEAMLAAATTWFVINAGQKVAIGHFLVGDLIWILTAQSAVLRGRRHQLGVCRAGRLPRLRQIHAALRARESRQGQAVRRQAGARAGRAVPHRRDVPVLLQCHVRARIRAEAVSRSRLQFHRAGRGNRHQPAVRLCRRIRRAVVDAMGAAEADRAHLSGKPAHEQPHHRAGLYRVGQRIQRQQLQSSTVALPASRAGCAKG